jgi:hypothetical protein
MESNAMVGIGRTELLPVFFLISTVNWAKSKFSNATSPHPLQAPATFAAGAPSPHRATNLARGQDMAWADRELALRMKQVLPEGRQEMRAPGEQETGLTPSTFVSSASPIAASPPAPAVLPLTAHNCSYPSHLAAPSWTAERDPAVSYTAGRPFSSRIGDDELVDFEEEGGEQLRAGVDLPRRASSEADTTRRRQALLPSMGWGRGEGRARRRAPKGNGAVECDRGEEEEEGSHQSV